MERHRQADVPGSDHGDLSLQSPTSSEADIVVLPLPGDGAIESLLEAYPDSFGVPPRMEGHHKVEAYLDQAAPAAVRRDSSPSR